MSYPFFSIIIPAFNVELYLPQCLDSVLNQTCIDYEIILIEDGSTDKTCQICDKYATIQDNIVVIHKKNAGLSEARNDGVRLAHGNYLFFLDSDDWIHNDNVLRNLKEKLINECQPDVLINLIATCLDGSTVIQNSSYLFNIELNSCSPLQIMQKILTIKNIFLGAQGFIIKRSVFIKNELWFYPNLYHEDILWFPQVFMRVKNVRTNNQEIFCYRMNRSNSITNSVSEKKINDCLKIIDLLLDDIKNISADSQKIIYIWICSIYRQILRKCIYIDDPAIILSNLKKKSFVLKYGQLKDKLLYILILLLGLFNVLKLLDKYLSIT